MILATICSFSVLSLAAQSKGELKQQQNAIDEIHAEMLTSDNILLVQAAQLFEVEYLEIEWSPTPRVYTFANRTNAAKRSKKKTKRKKERKEIDFTNKRWKSVANIVFSDGQPPIQTELYSYDYARHAIINAKEVNLEQQLQDYSQGLFGDVDHLIARCEGILDVDESMAKSADYFDHTYRDLSSYLFAGIRLYDIWAAETLVDILDEVATAFMIEVKGKETVRTRIGPQIYDQIKQNFFAYRRYRIVRHALGRLHLNPKAKIDPEFEPLRSNLNHAWMLAKHDPAIMSQRLQEAGNRDVFFAELSTELKAIYQPQLGLAVPEHFSKNRDDRAAASQLLQSISEKVLKSHELLGF